MCGYARRKFRSQWRQHLDRALRFVRRHHDRWYAGGNPVSDIDKDEELIRTLSKGLENAADVGVADGLRILETEDVDILFDVSFVFLTASILRLTRS